MKTFPFALGAMALILAAIPTLSFPLLVLAADNEHTPGLAKPADADSQNTPPYIPPANVDVPESSKVVPGDAGQHGHTNVLIRKSNENTPKAPTELSHPQPEHLQAPKHRQKKK